MENLEIYGKKVDVDGVYLAPCPCVPWPIHRLFPEFEFLKAINVDGMQKSAHVMPQDDFRERVGRLYDNLMDNRMVLRTFMEVQEKEGISTGYEQKNLEQIEKTRVFLEDVLEKLE